ncbi:MAG: 50S ribosomal protein L23 [Candidatus Andersenbacteria bacterium]|nr:50S ribosomal protein L23 [Candidatus Andersenbacteria bacterium]
MSILNKIIKKKDNKDEKEDVVISKDTKEKKEKKEKKEIKEKKVVGEKVAKKEIEDKKKNKPSAKTVKVKKVSKDKIPNHYFDLVKKPHISEKTFNLSNKNQYVFVVSDKANKSEIKKAIGNLYGVSVVSVNVVSVPAKPKRFKGRPGVKSGYKKAIVKLAEGNTIDLMKEAK